MIFSASVTAFIVPATPASHVTRRIGLSGSQGQYWDGRTPRSNNGPPNMAAANFVVITNGEGCALNGTAVAAVFMPRAFFPRVAIGCRLSLKIDRNLSPLGGDLIRGYII